MSVCSRVAHPIILLKALSILSLDKSSWVTLFFTDQDVELHVEAKNRNITAKAILPRDIFSNYVVKEVRFCVHLPTLFDSLLLLGLQALASPSMRLTLIFPTAEGRLFVELVDCAGQDESAISSGGVSNTETLQSQLVAKSIKERPLDLQFQDCPLRAQATVLGDALRDAIQDLFAAQCTEAALAISSQHGLQLRGSGLRGDIEVILKRHSEVVLYPESDNHLDEKISDSCVSTRVQTHHLSLACGCGRFVSSLGSSGPGRSTSALANVGVGLMSSGAAGFECLTLQINSQRQLNVVHKSLEDDTNVTVKVVLNPIRDCDEL